MHRRRALAALAILAASTAGAQPQTRQVARIRRVALLFFGTPENSRDRRDAFVKSMLEHGYADGRNVRYELRYGNGQPDVVDRHARELERSVVDAIASFSTPGTLALRAARVDRPIVMIGIDDPVRLGLAENLSHPGSNFTGITTNVLSQVPRYVDLMHEALGRGAHVGLLASHASSTYEMFRSRAEAEAARVGLRLTTLDAAAPGDIDRLLERAEPLNGLIVTSDAMLYNERRRIVELANAQRVPAIYPRIGYVQVGGLMSHAPNEDHAARRGAAFVARILDGDVAADMPIESPTRYELTLNRKTARATGLELPQSLYRKADRVIG